MQLDTFLKKNCLALSNPVLLQCRQGLERMAQSVDVTHDLRHVEEIVGNLDRLINDQQALKEQLNFEVLFLAICWHDVWKATRFPGGLFGMIFAQYWDGPGSARMFKVLTEKSGVDKALLQAARQVILEHGDLNLGWKASLESQVLQDIDALEVWNLQRLKILQEKYGTQVIKPAQLRMAEFYFKHFMASKNGDQFRYAWSKKEFQQRKTAYFLEVERLRQLYKP